MKKLIGFSRHLSIPFGDRLLDIYVQSYNGKQIEINIYYYDKKPYDNSVDSESEVFSLGFSFRI